MLCVFGIHITVQRFLKSLCRLIQTILPGSISLKSKCLKRLAASVRDSSCR